jgi:hypothetical protein
MVTVTLPDGNKVQATQEEFVPTKEEWNEYKLTDGTIIRIKIVVSEIFRLDQKDPATGKPNFMVKSKSVMSTIIPG